MAIIKKTIASKNLSNYSVLVNDVDANSKYFKITELPDTFTGGKNAFLVAGGLELVPDTKIQIELKDSNGDVIYHEPGEGLISSSINGENFVTEYYEGVSKVVSVYIYPDTAFGECTLTILGELSQYTDSNGIVVPVPSDWENKYNVKWTKTINVNPSLANTTKIRFYQRPTASISEILSPIYKIENDLKVASAVTQSFANIKLSNLETFAGDVKRVKVFRTSEGDISDYDLIQDILIESKELLTSYGLSGSVVGLTGILTPETLKNNWNTGSLNAFLTSSRVESGVRLTGSGYFTYTSSLDIKSTNAYELNLDAFYSSSTSSNLGIYLSWVSQSTTFSSSIATLTGTTPTKNLLDTVIPFKINRDYPSASLYFSQSQGEWHLGNISLKLSQDTAFSPDEISFVTTMPSLIENQTYNFKFEFYDVNNNYVPVAVTQSALFTGGNVGDTAKLLTFTTDRSAFRFSTGSFANPVNQTVKLSVQKTNLTASVTYASSAFDVGGNYITPASYAGTYPGTLTAANDNGALLTIANFSGSVASVLVGSIVYTASCEGFTEFETIYRFEDGDNAPGVFVTANTNQFIYKATDLSLNPSGQIITIEAKRKNLASAVTPLTVNSGSGKPALTFVSTNTTNGVDTYTLAGSSYPYSTGETTYYISGSDQFGNQFSDAIKVSPVKILDGFSIAASNENTSFPADSAGTVIGGFVASSGSITVKVGNEVISYASPIANNKFSASISATSGLTANTFNGTNYSINALSQDSGSLTLLVKYQDGGGTIISSSKEITYSKVKKASPVLSFIVGNNAQVVTAKSTGAQLDSFITASLSVIETYDGISSTKTLTAAPTTTATNSYTIGNKTTTTITLPNMANGTDSVDIAITGSVIDSESITRNVYGNISLAKTKKAVPNVEVSVSPQSQTVTANPDGSSPSTPTSLTVKALEGSATKLTSVTAVGTSVTVGTITNDGASSPYNFATIPLSAVAADNASVAITINYTDSEGTAGTKTLTALISKAKKGTTGDIGADGKRTATGMVFYQPTSATQPATPAATSYTFSTNVFGSLTTNWAVGAPTYASGNTNKYWYSTYTAVETTAGGGTAVPSFSAPVQAINFTGLVTFTSTDKITDGTNTSNIVPSGSITNHIGGANVTTINGGRISTGVITSEGYGFVAGTADTVASGSYMADGTIFNLNNGSLRSKNFYISSTGVAVFRGTLAAAGGTFSGDISAATGTFTGGVSGTGYSLNNSGLNLTNASSVITLGGVTLNSSGLSGTGFTLNSSGLNLSNAASSISLGNGVVLNSSGLTGTGFSLTTTGVVASAGAIAGWTITDTALSKSNGIHTISLNSTDAAYYITRNSTNQTKVKISPATTIPAIVVDSFDFVNFQSPGQARLTVNESGAASATVTITATSGRGDTDAGTGYAGTGIIWLQYPTEEIWVDGDGEFGLYLLQFFATIAVSGFSVNTDDEVSADYSLTLVAEKYSNYTNALNRTNLIQTYRSTIAESNLTKIAGEVFDYSDYTWNVSGGGFQVDSNQNWFYVYLEERFECSVYNGIPVEDFPSVTMYDYGGTIKVQFGRVDSGFSQLSPAGLQVYTGVRTYMNASVSGAPGENFFEVKGRSQFLSGLSVNGTFSASNKQFQITHPLNKNKWLYHTSIEGPQADLIYRGKLNLINGEGSCNIDVSSRLTNGTFNALTRNPQLFLQNNDSFDRIKGKIENGNVYVVSENENSSASVDWTVIAERCDNEILMGGTYGGDGKYKTEKWKREFRNSLMITGSV